MRLNKTTQDTSQTRNDSPWLISRPRRNPEEPRVTREGSFNARLLSEGVSRNHHGGNILMRVLLPKELNLPQLSNFFSKKYNSNNPMRLEGHSDLASNQIVQDTSSLSQHKISKRDQILEFIRSHLPETAFKFQPADNWSPEEGTQVDSPQMDLQMSPQVSLLYEEIRLNFSEKNSLYFYCQGSKDLNIAFQLFIMDMSLPLMALIRNKGIEEFQVLVTNKHGNYLIQRIVQKDSLFCDFVVQSCKNNFETLASNEYSSRVMQLLVKERSDFRDFVHHFFKENIRFACSKLTVTFLIMIAMRYSQRTADFLYVHEAMVQDQSLAGVALFKRILISYFQFADQAMALGTYSLLRKICSFESFFDKKFNSLLLLMIVRRGFDPIVKDIFKSLSKKFVSLIDRRCFKLIIEKLLQGKYATCRCLLKDSLTKVGISDLITLLKKSPDNFNYYLYLVVGSFNTTETLALEAFLEKLHQSTPTKGTLLEGIALPGR